MPGGSHLLSYPAKPGSNCSMQYTSRNRLGSKPQQKVSRRSGGHPSLVGWDGRAAMWYPSAGYATWVKSWPGAVWKQIPGIWRPFGRLLKSPSGILGKRPFWAQSWPGAVWKQISGIWPPLGRLLNFPSGILAKRPFWAKSWPGAFWKQISGIWRPLGV